MEVQTNRTNTNNVNKTTALLQTTGGTDEPNNVNKTTALLQTTGGKDETNNVNKTTALLQTTGGKDKPYLHYLCLFVSSVPPVVCRRAVVLFTLFVFVRFVFISSCL
jgi:hypothetical protein